MSESRRERGLWLPPTLLVAVARQLAAARQLPVITRLPTGAVLLTLAALQAADPGIPLSALTGPLVTLGDLLPNNECWFYVGLPVGKSTENDPLRDRTLDLPSTIDTIIDVKPTTPLEAGGEEPSSEDPISETPEVDASLPRKVNLWLRYADDHSAVPETATLAVNTEYLLGLNIGAHHADSRLGADAPAVPTPEIPAAGLELLVSVIAEDGILEFAAPLQPLTLPQLGDSAPLELAFTPRQRCEDTLVWVHVYYRWTLVQTVELHLAVTQREQDLAAPLPPARVQFSRSADFSDLEALRPAALNLRMWQQDGLYRLAVTWPGPQPAGRRDPVRGLQLTLPINPQSLADTIMGVRDDLYRITTHASYRTGVKGKLKEKRESLYVLAAAGNRLYAELFFPSGATAEQHASLQAFAAWLRDLTGATPPRLTITHEAPGVGLPWGLLYPEPVPDANHVRPELFWGCRYELEIMTAQLARNAQSAPPARETISIVGGTYNFVTTPAHLAALQALDAASARVTLDLRDRADRAALTTLLSDGDIVYMFCHGHTAKAGADTADGLARLQELLKLASQDPAAYADVLKVQEVYTAPDADLNEDWLRWTNARLALHHLTQWALTLPRKPLVLLNMCESAQVLPTITGGFVPYFSQIGARGVLGTECPMLATFAAAWGEALLERLAAGERIGAALPALRRHFLETQHNPLGLAYTYYGTADVQF